MSRIRRFAVYMVPDGHLADFGAAWLGWDITIGQTVQQPQFDLPRPLAELTKIVAPYGFHATIKPPFRLAAGLDHADLAAAVSELAGRLNPVVLDRLALTDRDGVLALTPVGEVSHMNALAATVVRDLDRFRAPAPDSEQARLRALGLTAAQETNLIRWGYPYVMEEFRFHLTLTGRLSPTEAKATRDAAMSLLTKIPLAPVRVADLALVGQTETGWFRLIQRYPLSA